MRSVRRAADLPGGLGGLVMLALVLGSATPAPAAPVVHPRILQTIRDCRRAWIVRLGPPQPPAPGEIRLAAEREGPIAGYRVLERIELPRPAAVAFAGVLGSAGSYAASAPSRAAGAVAPTRVGLTFEANGGFAHAMVLPASAAIELEFFNGVQVPAMLSERGRAGWERALAGYLRSRGMSRRDFDRAFVDGGNLLSGAEPAPAGEAGAAPVPAAPPLPRAADPGRVGTAPIPVTKVAPAYPDIAREAGVEGTVLVACLVDSTGVVVDARVKKSIPMLDAAAIAAARAWRFEPAASGGARVAAWTDVPVRFSLH